MSGLRQDWNERPEPISIILEESIAQNTVPTTQLHWSVFRLIFNISSSLFPVSLLSELSLSFITPVFTSIRVVLYLVPSFKSLFWFLLSKDDCHTSPLSIRSLYEWYLYSDTIHVLTTFGSSIPEIGSFILLKFICYFCCVYKTKKKKKSRDKILSTVEEMSMDHSPRQDLWSVLDRVN